MKPDRGTAVVLNRGRKEAQALSKAAGVFAIPGGLIEKVREESQEQQRKGDAVEEVHPDYDSPKPATVAGFGVSVKNERRVRRRSDWCAGPDLFGALQVDAFGRVDTDTVTLLDEWRNLHGDTGLQLCRLGAV